MTHEEAWAHVNRQISAETGGPYVVPPWLKKAEKKEDDERPGSGKQCLTPQKTHPMWVGLKRADA